MKIDVLNKQGNKKGEVDININVGNVSSLCVSRIVKAYLANKRRGTASSKTRGDVSGGGKKPWRQKGTGRARAGSIRSPLWVGGGVCFGPKPRTYKQKVNKKERKKVYLWALSQKITDGDLIVVEEFDFSSPKTKEACLTLKNLGVEKGLVVVSNDMVNSILSMRNIEKIELKEAHSVNVYDILRYEKIVVPQKLLPEMLKGV
ncbi:MAG: 50S ribosomal protein L4 [Desulfurellaceae bacterium]|jgi:large subunit ribosomal protein L4|nr:50S ribosomal protein L4 [Desulfurellaceae bacterium]